MTLHVVGLPHTRFTDDFSWCAYTTKVARFARMMTDAGMEVVTYGNGEAELAGKYVMVTDKTFDDHFIADFNPSDPYFSEFNSSAIARIYEHIEPGDILCLIGGSAQAPIHYSLGAYPCVEFGVGYEGIFAPHRVFESYTWQHYVYGMNQMHGHEGDTVIYNYFDPADFHQAPSEGYVAFLGRVCHVKGTDIAVTAAREAGVPIKIAGHVFDDHAWVKDLGDAYVGELGPKDRADFLAGACALVAPTRYVEPFGGVQAEAMLSGVPVIGPDFGAFAEFIDDTNGVRCRSVGDYVGAISRAAAGDMPRGDSIRYKAAERFSMWNIGRQYRDYFDGIAR